MQHQRGFIQNLILPSLVLLGIVIGSLNYLLDTNQRGRAISENAQKARNHISVVRDALTVCRVTWPAGDNGTGVNVNYPATPGGGEWGPIENLVCPGSGTNLWVATNYMLSQYAADVDPWQYQNTTNGIKIRIASKNQDGDFILKQVAQRLSAGEQDLNTASNPNTLVVTLKN